MNKRFVKIIVVAVMLYLGLALYAFLASNLQIFLPPRPANYKMSSKFIKIPVAEHDYIAAVYLPNSSAKYTIIYSHGNAGDLGYAMPFLLELRKSGYSVLSYDYEGYGLSSGMATENNTYRDVLAAYNYATTQLKVRPDNIISMGHSLGAALATYLADKKPTAGLILMSPFTSIFRTRLRYNILWWDMYDSLPRIKRIHVPLLMIHGEQDGVIAPWHSKALYASANQPKQLLVIKRAGHNNLAQVGQEKFWQAIRSFLKNT
jgi:abhydrolase domain-containing protein 17